MQCQDNSKLRTPLNEVCVTPDIGCVPLVQGKPDCNPQPDQIPFAFDPWTTTLWIFNCRTREWVPFQKFRLCNDLVEVNLENLNHICEILRIPVFFNAGNGCQEGWITLQELVEQIKKCLHLKWQALCVDVNTLKINIKGLEDSLPPWYVRFENLWPVCGTGEEDDPIVIQTHDPLCKWPIKTVDDVVDAEVKHLGACLDDEMVRVPFPPRPCEFPQMTETAIASIPKERKNLIACVDGEEKKVPWIETPCEYPQYSQSQVENAADADVIFCVDGKNVKVPIPPNFFGLRPCEFPRTTQHLVESAHEKDIIICVDGVDHKVPVPSSFFTPDYLCVPEVVGMPTGPPAPGTGPLRADCDGTLWVWVCETGKWVPYNTGITDSVPHYKQSDVTGDICENVHFKAWYDSKSSTDPCLTESQMTLSDLALSLKECGDNTGLIEKIIAENAGAAVYTAGTHYSKFSNLYYSANSSSMLITSKDGRVIIGSGRNLRDSPPFGIVSVKLKNDKKHMLKLFMVFHQAYLSRPSKLRQQCNIGLFSYVTNEPPIVDTNIAIRNWFLSQGITTDFIDEDKETRIQRYLSNGINAYAQALMGTTRFDITKALPYNSNIATAKLSKNDIVLTKLQYSLDGRKVNFDMDQTTQVTFFYLPPETEVICSQQALIYATGITSSTIYSGFRIRMHVLELPSKYAISQEGDFYELDGVGEEDDGDS